MKLKHITLVFILLFGILVVYFIVAGELFYNPHQKPTISQIKTEIRAIKEGMFTSDKPGIVH